MVSKKGHLICREEFLVSSKCFWLAPNLKFSFTKKHPYLKLPNIEQNVNKTTFSFLDGVFTKFHYNTNIMFSTTYYLKFSENCFLIVLILLFLDGFKNYQH